MNMDLDNIEKLLAKYLEAKTTLQEEALLKNYFTSNNVASHLREYKGMFQYFANNKEERFTKSIRLKTNNKKRKWIGIAASIVFLLGIYGVNSYQNKQEAKRAYVATQQTLELIAKQMNKGTVAIGELNNFVDTKQKVFK